MKMPSNKSPFYRGRVPVDLLDVPNNETETWLKDPKLILIFMEIIPNMAAFIIFLMFLTLMTVGMSLLVKHVKLIYSRRVRLKRSMVKRRRKRVRRQKIIDKESADNNHLSSSSSDMDFLSVSTPQQRPIIRPRDKMGSTGTIDPVLVDPIRKDENNSDIRGSDYIINLDTTENVSKGRSHKMGQARLENIKMVTKETVDDKGEVGILTGIRRKTLHKVKHYNRRHTGVEDLDHNNPRKKTQMPKFLQNKVHRTFIHHQNE